MGTERHPGAVAVAAVVLWIAAVLLFPSHAAAIPAQAALAGISFMIPIVPAVCLLLVSIYLLAARHLKLKGVLARVPGALFLVLLTVFCFTFFVKFSSSVGGLIDPAAEARLIEFITDNAVQRQEIAGLDRSAGVILAEPPSIRGTPFTISPADAVREAAAGRLLLVDVRPASEFSSGHLKGAWRFPRYEIELAVPDYHSQTVTDIYLKSLAERAVSKGQKIALCCSFGVSLSYRTVIELRRGGVAAVMVSGGCTALRKAGGEFVSGPAVAAGTQRPVAPEIVAAWEESGLVRTVRADESIVADLGESLPRGPLVVTSAGDSARERALMPVVSAIAQARGIVVAARSVSGSPGDRPHLGVFGTIGRGLRHAGAVFGELSGGPGPFLLLLVFSVLAVLSLAAVRKSARAPAGWVGLVLSLVATVAVFVMIEGTWAAIRIGLYFGENRWIARLPPLRRRCAFWRACSGLKAACHAFP